MAPPRKRTRRRPHHAPCREAIPTRHDHRDLLRISKHLQQCRRLFLRPSYGDLSALPSSMVLPTTCAPPSSASAKTCPPSTTCSILPPRPTSQVLLITHGHLSDQTGTHPLAGLKQSGHTTRYRFKIGAMPVRFE